MTHHCLVSFLMKNIVIAVNNCMRQSFITQDASDRDYMVRQMKKYGIPVLNYAGERTRTRPLNITPEVSRLDQAFVPIFSVLFSNFYSCTLTIFPCSWSLWSLLFVISPILMFSWYSHLKHAWELHDSNIDCSVYFPMADEATWDLLPTWSRI